MQASYIVRAYNAEKTIARTLTSILAQDFSGTYEAIVVDDGSKDATSEVVQSFKDERIRLIRQENKGFIEAGVSGLRAATGDLCLYLDADDESLPHTLATAVEAYGAGEVDYVWGDYLEEFEGVQKRVEPSSVFQSVIGAFAWDRRKLIEAGGLMSDTIFPEYDLLLRTFGKWRGVRVHKPLFIYHRSSTSMTGDHELVDSSIKRLGEKYPDLAKEVAKIRSYKLDGAV